MLLSWSIDFLVTFLHFSLSSLRFEVCLQSQAGGPFYPIFTGRRDSIRSYHDEALAEIPRPDDNITQTLHLFSLRGFNERETVSLLGTYKLIPYHSLFLLFLVLFLVKWS